MLTLSPSHPLTLNTRAQTGTAGSLTSRPRLHLHAQPSRYSRIIYCTLHLTHPHTQTHNPPPHSRLFFPGIAFHNIWPTGIQPPAAVQHVCWPLLDPACWTTPILPLPAPPPSALPVPLPHIHSVNLSLLGAICYFSSDVLCFTRVLVSACALTGDPLTPACCSSWGC